MKTKLFLFSVVAAIFILAPLGCASVHNGKMAIANEPRDPSSLGNPTSFSEHIGQFGYNVYYANLHSHHYMKYKVGKAGKAKGMGDDTVVAGPCDPKIFGSFPNDDGRPCLVGKDGQPEFVLPPGAISGQKVDKLAYYKMACDYAREKGGLQILFVTPHSKNNSGDGDTDTGEQSYVERHHMVGDINKSYDGSFYCGLGQEASSISSGNHSNIFGQFRSNNSSTSKPIFFPSGEYEKYYPQVKNRNASGEHLILQFNHPDVDEDIAWNLLSEVYDPNKKSSKEAIKEKFNDYGIDDIMPAACLRSPQSKRDLCTSQQRPERATREILRETFAKLRDMGADAYRLVEVTETTGFEDHTDKNTYVVGATTNYSEKFLRVHNRFNKAGSNEWMPAGLRAYVFFLDMGFKISPTANQDNHFANFGTALASRTGVLAPSLAENDVFSALENRKTFATEDRNAKLFLSGRGDAGVVPMGQDVGVKGDSIEVTMSYQDDDDGQVPVDVRIYAYNESDALDYSREAGKWGAVRTVQNENGVPRLNRGAEVPQDFKNWIKSGEAKTLRIPLKKGRTNLFVEIAQKDRDRVWSAPLFITSK